MATVNPAVAVTANTQGGAADVSGLGPSRTIAVRANAGGTFKLDVGGTNGVGDMAPLQVKAPNGTITDWVIEANQAITVNDASDWTMIRRVDGTGAGVASIDGPQAPGGAGPVLHQLGDTYAPFVVVGRTAGGTASFDATTANLQ